MLNTTYTIPALPVLRWASACLLVGAIVGCEPGYFEAGDAPAALAEDCAIRRAAEIADGMARIDADADPADMDALLARADWGEQRCLGRAIDLAGQPELTSVSDAMDDDGDPTHSEVSQHPNDLGDQDNDPDKSEEIGPGGEEVSYLAPEDVAAIAAETVIDNGPIINRLDFVVMGDGYRQEDLETYHTLLDTRLAALANYEPFSRYASYFNFHRFDTLSENTGSGRDNPTVFGTYYCGANILGANCWETIRHTANELAPWGDQTIVLANAEQVAGSSYGAIVGVAHLGYEIAIASKNNQWAFFHELGHSLGKLADEYLAATFAAPNVSWLPRADWAPGEFWSHWLDEVDPNLGVVDTHELNTSGTYTPTEGSIMWFGSHFCPVGKEQLLHQIYDRVRPVDGGTPEGSYNAATTRHLHVQPMRPLGNPLSIEWRAGNQLLGTREVLDLRETGLPAGTHTITAEVADLTPWVRKAKYRERLTQTLSYAVAIPSTLPAPAVVSVTPGHTGTYYNPETDGQGFTFEYAGPNHGVLYWYTYEDDVSRLPTWYVVDGQFQGTHFVGEILSFSGGTFVTGATANMTVRGTFDLDFYDCAEGNVHYTLDGLSGAFPFTRLSPQLSTPDGTALCGGGSVASYDTEPAFKRAHTGSWFDPAHDRQGFTIEYIDRAGADDEILLYWYTYAPAGGELPTGQPIWIVGSGTISAGATSTLTLYATDGGYFQAKTGPKLLNVGSATIAPTSCSELSFDYDVDIRGATDSGQIPLLKLAAPLLPCE